MQLNTRENNTPCGPERCLLDPVFPLRHLSCTQRLVYTVCGKTGSIDTNARALVLQYCGRTAMIIPHHLLNPDALRGVIEAFVTREGTDYGAQEVSLATKVFQVHQQLDAGAAVLLYDEDTESCTIQPTHQLPVV